MVSCFREMVSLLQVAGPTTQSLTGEFSDRRCAHTCRLGDWLVVYLNGRQHNEPVIFIPLAKS
jgi:hypothetical protein